MRLVKLAVIGALGMATALNTGPAKREFDKEPLIEAKQEPAPIQELGVNVSEDEYGSSVERAAFLLGRIESGDYSCHDWFRREVREAIKENPITAAVLLMKYSKLLEGEKKEYYQNLAEKLFKEHCNGSIAGIAAAEDE